MQRLLQTLTVLAAAPTLISAGWIDMETPLNKRTTKSLVDGTTYHLVRHALANAGRESLSSLVFFVMRPPLTLATFVADPGTPHLFLLLLNFAFVVQVMSDEFNVENRTFKDGHDPVWTALDKSDDDASSAGGGSMQFYNSSAVSIENGMLKIATYLETTEWNRYDHVKKEWKREITNFTSGMVQSWNKFCFTGGIVEVDIIFPGEPHIGGLWPAVWMLGNLGRATYEASTNNLWPWSYDTCNRELQQGQTLSACNAENHFGMNPFQGRGATEIDIVEVMTGESNGPLPSTEPPVGLPYADLTLQVCVLLSG